MSKKEKIIIIIFIISILILLSVSSILLFGKNRNTMSEMPTAVTVTPTKAVLTPYPTIHPPKNMTVLMNERRFSPSNFSIPRGGFVDFMNISSDSITIESGDEKSSILNIGAIKPDEVKRVGFVNPGKYTYKNRNNPKQIGTIIIQ